MLVYYLSGLILFICFGFYGNKKVCKYSVINVFVIWDVYGGKVRVMVETMISVWRVIDVLFRYLFFLWLVVYGDRIELCI